MNDSTLRVSKSWLVLLLVVLVAAFGAGDLYAQSEKNWTASKSASEENQWVSQVSLDNKIDMRVFSFGLSENLAFFRIQLTNISELSQAGTMKFRPRHWSNGPSESGEGRYSGEFSLGVGESTHFEFLSHSGYFHPSVNINLQSSSKTHSPSFPTPQKAIHVFAGRSSAREALFVPASDDPLRALPKSTPILSLLSSITLRTDALFSTKELKQVREAAKLGTKVYLSIETPSEEVMERVSTLLGTPMTERELEKDFDFFRTMISSAGASARGNRDFPSGLALPSNIVELSNRASTAPDGSFALYGFGLGYIGVETGLDLNWAIRFRQRSFNPEPMNYGESGTNFGGSAYFRTIGSEMLLSPYLLLAFLIIAALATVLFPVFFFRQKRAPWLVVGVSIVSLGLCAFLLSARSIAHSSAPDGIEFQILEVDGSGKIQSYGHCIQVRGDVLEGSLSSDEDTMILVASGGGPSSDLEFDLDLNGTTISLAEAVDEGERSIYLMRKANEETSDVEIRLGFDGSEVKNEGNLAIRLGLYGISSDAWMLIPALEPGDSAKPIKLVDFFELPFSAQLDGYGLEKREIAYLTDPSRPWKSKAIADDKLAVLFVETPEGIESIEGPENKVTSTIAKLRFPSD